MGDGPGRPVATLQGHSGGVWSVALSADGRLVASGGGDGTVRLWETGSGRLVASLEGHSGGVYSVALSADGRLVASGSLEGTVRLWEVATGQRLATLAGVHQCGLVPGTFHGTGCWSVALGKGRYACGTLLPVSRWPAWRVTPVESTAWRCPRTGGWWRVRASMARCGCGRPTPDSPWPCCWGTPGPWPESGAIGGRALVASAGFDGTVRVWEASNGTCLRVLRPERRYERMDITRLTGVTMAQRSALLALGAIEHGE